MTQSYYPTTDDFIAGKKARGALLTTWLITVTLLVVGVMTVLTLFYPNISPTPVYMVGLVAFLALMLPVLIWQYPQAGVYILFAGALMFPSGPRAALATMPTSDVPFWWNLSSTGQYYTNSRTLSAVVISPAEILMVMTFLIWIVRAIVNREFRFEKGAFFGAIAVYMGMVAFGFIHGISKGGADTTIALYEVRGQAYFFLAYLMTVNIVTDAKMVKGLLWTAIFCTGVQGISGAISYVILKDKITEDGFMAHDESLFLNLLFLIALIALTIRKDRRLIFWAMILVPVALTAVLGNQRRAGIAAFMIAFMPVLPILWVVLKEQRTRIARVGIVLGLLASIYMPIAWNGQGAWALPARAIRSQSDPSIRDAGSDAYRWAETEDLKATRNTSPWIGIGYGHPFLQPFPLPAVSTDFLKYMPHNSILWIWMRLGHLGFFCFFMMLATFFIKGVQILKSVTRPELHTIGVLGIGMVLMLVTFGKFDLALINSRIMFTTALLIGILAILPKLEKGDAQAQESSGEEEETESEETPRALAPDTTF